MRSVGIVHAKETPSQDFGIRFSKVDDLSVRCLFELLQTTRRYVSVYHSELLATTSPNLLALEITYLIFDDDRTLSLYRQIFFGWILEDGTLLSSFVI